MIFEHTTVPDVWCIRTERLEDDRGWFCRTWDADEFAQRGIDGRIAQCSASFNASAGTLRGMHYQAAPFEETKLVRCVRGAVFDVVIDLRPGSPAFGTWVGRELSADNGLMLSIPAGCAHGFQTLVAESELSYQISERYSPDHQRGVRWNDPAFAIRWPDAPAGGRIISERDRSYGDFRS